MVVNKHLISSKNSEVCQRRSEVAFPVNRFAREVQLAVADKYAKGIEKSSLCSPANKVSSSLQPKIAIL